MKDKTLEILNEYGIAINQYVIGVIKKVPDPKLFAARVHKLYTEPVSEEEIRKSLGNLYDKYRSKGRQQWIDVLYYYIHTRSFNPPNKQ